MKKSGKNFFINNPIFLKYKKRFNFSKFRSEEFLKSVYINERIIEIPFAIQAMASLPQGAKILDLGCTESPLPLQLACLGYQVTGFDFREYPYQHPNLQFFQGDMAKLPFEKEVFDAVLGISTLEHLGFGFYQDPAEVAQADQKAMTEALRVLVKGGMFILSVPYGAGARNSQQRIYNEKSLALLLSDLHIEEIRYFKNTQLANAPCNTWIEVDSAQAGLLPMLESTCGVCLVKAKK